jgi:hydrogenase nickel incorporation protein HypB
MCTVCGCGGTEEHQHDHEHDHHHHHHRHPFVAKPVADNTKISDLHFGKGPAHAHAPGLTQTRMVQIEQDIMSKNDAYAEANRAFFKEHKLQVFNLMSSPGSGKTTLLTETIDILKDKHSITVVEGDQQTSNDADRIRATGVQAVQVNTGKGCHLDAHMVGHAMQKLQLQDNGLIFIENVGNLVCPAGFDLGEAAKVVILSVTEGEDKPLKYPDMFHAADVIILNKIDLLPYLDFDVAQCIENARKLRPDIEVLQVSAKSGAGMQDWCEWLLRRQTSTVQVSSHQV